MPRKTPATLRAEQDAALWKSRASRIKAEYDVLKTNRLRRQPKRETTDEGGIVTPEKRAKSTNVGRDLERNYSSARGIVTQFRANVVGSEGKLQVNVAGGAKAAAWFNKDWARHCDFRDDIHFSMVCQNVVAAAIREGDMLAVFDDDLIEDTGKLITWEADQIVPLAESLKGLLPEGAVQDGGIVRDKWGRVTHFVTTGKHGLTLIDNADDATVWPRSQAVMPRSPWRLNQGRGAAPMLTAASSFLDLYEMLSRELQTAKKAAGQYAMINREDAVDDWDNPGTKPAQLPENDGKSETTAATEGANSATNKQARNYEALEALYGGHVDYGTPGDKINFPPADRPNVNMPEFIEAVLCHAGAAFGLARAYAMLRADTSYTAFRGDMILSWAGAFYPAQKWLERSFADWVGVRALRWAMRKRLIPTLPAGWETALSWKWPTMPEVDQLDYENSVAQALKNGTTDYATLLGPDWLQRLEGLAKQIAEIRRLGLPLSILELKSGGTANPKKDEPKPKEQADEQD
jgi:capsid protein